MNCGNPVEAIYANLTGPMRENVITARVVYEYV